MKHFTIVQPHKRWHPRDWSYCETFNHCSTSQKVASQTLFLFWNLVRWFNLTKGGVQRLVLLWNMFLLFNHTKGGILDISFICKTFYHGSTSQKVASQKLVLLWNILPWFHLTKGGLPEISLIVKPFTMVQPHKRWHPRDQSYCETFYYSSTSQKVASQRSVLLWNLLSWFNLTKGGIPEISLIVRPFTIVQPHKRWHPRDNSYCETIYYGSTSKRWHPRD